MMKMKGSEQFGTARDDEGKWWGAGCRRVEDEWSGDLGCLEFRLRKRLKLDPCGVKHSCFGKGKPVTSVPFH